MKLLIGILAFVIRVLIAIGDTVIFFFSLPVRLGRAILQLLKKQKLPRISTLSLHHFPIRPIKILRAKFFTLQASHSKTLLKTKSKTHKDRSLPKIKLSLPMLSLPHIAFSLPKPRKRMRHPIQAQYTREQPRARFASLPFFVKTKYFFAGSVFSLLFIFIPVLSLVYLQDLPSPRILSLGQIPQTTKIYDRNGTLLYQIYGGQNRTVVPLGDIPKNLQNATIAIEDHDFYEHPGFNILAITRSFLSNSSGKELQGGSTITQQLIKSALLTPETSITRKVKEAILAFWAERLYTKRQILEMYFNQIPYGGTAWGAEAASQTYFDKHVKDLDLAESAFLAGIPQAPTTYSPYGPTPTAWKKRQKDVLYHMQTLGYITKAQANDALNEELHFQAPQTPIHAPHFVMYIKDFLVKKYDLPMVEKGGLTVVTSLDLKLQDDVQKIVSDEVNANAYLNLNNGAAVVTNPKNGDILAMVGSRDFNYPGFGNYNVATALRQPGSSIKVVTYATSLSMGMTAATILDDSPVAYPSYPGGPVYAPVNYDGRSHGRVPLRIAFANSFNITAVRTLNQVGIPNMISTAKKMGISTWNQDPSQYGLSITLGSAETTMLNMATVYGTVANAGTRVDLNPLLKVTDSKGNVLEEKPAQVQGEKALDSGVTYIISSILADNAARSLEFGPNSPLNIPGKTVSVKTGTSDWKKDNWTIGFTPNILTAVWVGNPDNSPMSQSLASGITGAAPIWNKIMTKLLADKPDVKPDLPEDIVQKPCNGKLEFFVRGTENSVGCSFVLPTSGPSPTPQTH